MTVRQNDARPLRMQIADDIGQQIKDGTYAVGDKLPSLRGLAHQYGVAEPTVHAAIRDLQQSGLVSSTSGRGTFVASSPDDLGSVDDQLTEVRRRLDAIEARLDRGP